MRSNHLIAAVIVSLSCVLLSASCAEHPTGALDDSTGEAQPTEPTDETEPTETTDAGEPIGEAQQPETKAECYAAWKFRNKKCNDMPGDLRGACLWVSSMLLRDCLKHAS